MSFYFLLLLVVILSSVLGILVWYIFRLIKSLKNTYDYVFSLLGKVKDYHLHLEKVHNMDTFYGDSVLGGLLEHTRELEATLNEAVEEGYEMFGPNAFVDTSRDDINDTEETNA